MNSAQEHFLREQVAPLFAKQWPETFFTEKLKVKPLAVGIAPKIAESGAAPELLSRARVFLNWYTSRPCYLRALAEGKDRVDLEGKTTKTTEEHRKFAADKFIAEMKRRGHIKGDVHGNR